MIAEFLVIGVNCQLLLLTQNYKAALCGIVKLANISNIFSKRELTFAHAPYSGGCNFWQYFYGMWYAGHPLTSAKNFTEIVPGERLRRES